MDTQYGNFIQEFHDLDTRCRNLIQEIMKKFSVSNNFFLEVISWIHNAEISFKKL